MTKSLLITYILWLFGGFCGLHHFYLNRDRHAFVMWMTFGGYFGLGWFRELWRIPEYVKDANDDKDYLADLVSKMKRYTKPPTPFIRHSATIIVADILGYLTIGAIPVELFSDQSFLPYIHAIIAPLAVAIGIY